MLKSAPTKPAKGLARLILIATGLLCTVLAVLGIFLPLLPTVPLLLLAAACFARSSERFHSRLLAHPQLGPIIRSYQNGQGIPLRAKVTAISLLWLTIPISVFFFLTQLWLQICLITIGLAVTIYLLRLPLCPSGGD